MRRQEIEFEGEELVDKILGTRQDDGSRRHTYFDNEFFYRGSAMRQARENYLRSLNHPSIRPVPFVMPSARFDDHYSMNFVRDIAMQSPEEERYKLINPPIYKVTSLFYLGGGINHDSNTINFVDINHDIVIRDTTFLEQVYISAISSVYNVSFYNCIFEKDIQISYSKCNKIEFKDCKIQKLNFHNSGLNLIGLERNVSDGIFMNSVNVGENNYTSYINDFDHQIGAINLVNDDSREFKIENCKVGVIEFSIDEDFSRTNKQQKIDIKLNVESIKIESVKKKVSIDSLAINLKQSEGNTYSQLRNCSVENLNISGVVRKDSVLGVYSIDCLNLKIENFVNDGKSLFSNFRIIDGGTVLFYRADLGKFSLLGVNFEKATEFKIVESNIVDIVTNDTYFPSTIVGGGYRPAASKREIYRHFKNGAGKQGDRYSELKYEALEMEELRNILNSEKSHDRFIFNLNYCSSKHGQDWLRAGFWLIASALVVFCAIQYTLGYTNMNIRALPDNLASFVSFINPIHRIWEVFEPQNMEPYDGIAKLLDGSYRIISGYLIFQFLRAFRKYFR